MESSSIVIKVKLGDTLRRFNVPVHEGKLSFNMVMLRKKICSLFDLTPHVDFTLTYIDEDGDVVTLCDDDDLHDVTVQSLDPLRITVRLNTDKLDGSSVTPSWSSLLRSPQSQPLFQNLNSGVSEILKYVPEPMHNALSKILLDLASEAPSSRSVLAELVEKMKMTHLNKPSDSQAEYGSTNLSNKTTQIETVKKDVKFGDVQPPRSVDLNVSYSCPELVNTGNCGDAACSYTYGPQVSLEAVSVLKNIDTVAAGKKKKDTENIRTESPAGVERKSVGFGASNPDYLKRCLQDSKTTEISAFPWPKTIKATNDSSSSSGLQQMTLSAINECPFKGMPLSSDSTVHACPYASRIPPFKRSYNHYYGLGGISHMGVKCDGCGVLPIIGPRFTSKVKDDYDLCSICFEKMGNDVDYMRMDHPVISRNYSPLNHSARVGPPRTKPSLSKLDSCFVLDVNIRDGTIMPPFTVFTKIWRMRNNGNIVWPQGSQLRWTGGDRLSNTVSVEVKIPADGLQVDWELHIAVDFTAPELPGQYVSYWRMASPSGQEFGQRVWVLIQVDDGLKDAGETSINLNMTPVCTTPKDHEVVKPEMDQDNDFVGVIEPEDLFFDAEPHKDQEINFPINDTLIISNDSVPNQDQESRLLKELHDMGFAHGDLNKEVLRMNKYNLAQSVIDLCRILEPNPVHY